MDKGSFRFVERWGTNSNTIPVNCVKIRSIVLQIVDDKGVWADVPVMPDPVGEAAVDALIAKSLAQYKIGG